jgi:HEAT repeat protein
LAEKIQNGSAENQIFVIELLGKVGGRKAIETVAACTKSDDSKVKNAATQSLGAWRNADAAPVLLEIAKTDSDGKYRTRALRGYIRIARQLQFPADARLAMFRTAMETAKRNDEKQIALDILTRIPTATSLQTAVAYLGDAALKDRAADAAVKIGTKILRQDPKAVVVSMQKVVDANPEVSIGNRAKQLLGQAQAASK